MHGSYAAVANVLQKKAPGMLIGVPGDDNMWIPTTKFGPRGNTYAVC
jgi:hypothetical protein